MRWMDRAIKQTLLLILFLAVFVLFMVVCIVQVPASGRGTLTQSQRAEQLGTITGGLFGFGIVLIWALAFQNRNSSAPALNRDGRLKGESSASATVNGARNAVAVPDSA